MNCSGVFPVACDLALAPCFSRLLCYCVVCAGGVKSSVLGKNRRKFCSRKRAFAARCVEKIFLCVGACGFRREGVKLSEVGEGARIPARAGARSRAPKAGWFTGVARHFFSALFRLIFAAFALALIAGGKSDPARPCGTVRVPPRLFSLVVGNGGALGLPAFFLSPSARGGIVSHARAVLAVMIARRGRLRKVSAQISPLPVLKLYSTTSGETEIQSSPVALDSAAVIARNHSGASLSTYSLRTIGFSRLRLAVHICVPTGRCSTLSLVM